MKFCFNNKAFVEQDIQPNKLAVIGEDIALTWLEFETKVNAFISFLKKNNLDSTTKPVIVYGHKSANMLVAFYALMKLEIAYIPVDLVYPKERILKIATTVESEFIINTTEISLALNYTEVVLSGEKTILENTSTHILSSKSLTALDPIVYIIFTSGSTGEPKGVQISTEAVQSFVKWMTSADFNFSYNDVFVNTALLSFDLSVFEVMTFGAIGGTILLNSKEQCAAPKNLILRIKEYAGTVWISTPSFALSYTRENDTTLMNGLHTFLFCGEILPHPLAKKLKSLFSNTKILNTYGPTEATVATTIVEIDDAILNKYESLPVGVSKMDSTLILDEKEILIIGPNVSKGYVKNEELNKKKFFIHTDGSRGFRTGDNGYMEDGMLFFYGRNDDLVKLHGYRIELNEITAALNNLTYIKHAETIALKRNNVVKKIVSLVVLEDETTLTSKDITNDLSKTLPNYMLPSGIKFLDEIPLNQNGKSDKKLLQELYLKK